jgi:hypothetical protein
MRKTRQLIWCGLLLCSLLIIPCARADEQGVLANLAACKDFGFSTEEDFVTRGSKPPDGNPIISDGDLLGPNHAVCARNAELLTAWKVQVDLGLDAVDVVDIERNLVAFSTELDDPEHRFTAGDLLATNGAAIPNIVLLRKFQISHDMGLDGLQLIGSAAGSIGFLNRAAEISREAWLNDPGLLFTLLDTFKVDIWISTESTELRASSVPIFDGDLLSVGTGTIVVPQSALLPPAVPAGLPARGVDFGLDAVAASRNGDIRTIRFSTEILYRKEPAFTDGDVLKKEDGVEYLNGALVAPFEPYAKFLGLDALHINLPATATRLGYLPYVLKNER